MAPRLQAVRLAPGERIHVDGRPDEVAWAAAPKASGFTQREPEPGAASSERTEAAVLYDDGALYVAFWAHVRDPATLVAPLARRDAFPVTDRVSVDIDSYDDGRTAFSFAVTAGGVEQDLLVYDDVEEDATWDAVWEGEAARTADGYTVEIRIPFSQLRYQTGAGPQTWGIQFQRDIPASGEVGFWAPILPDAGGYVSRFGRLEGLEGLRAPRRVELLPYVAGRLTREPGDAADPFYA
ncbi:MAG TPA: carbohydrate binding family 9 domain-containing protein, partial [Rubricoccaceae bacterium]|nr:carbohydrate binding family 9 domain-containing protein [Rubricoccaceae bacterium]